MALEPLVDEELRRYVEYLQRGMHTPGWEAVYDLEAYKKHARAVPPLSVADFGVEAWAKYQRQILEFQPDTAFDSPITRFGFGPRLVEVLDAATRLGQAPHRPVILATSTGSSASPFAVPSDGHHLLFAGLGTASFCNYWSKAFARITGYLVADFGPQSATSERLHETLAHHPEAVILPAKLCAYHAALQTLLGFGVVSDHPGNPAYRIELVVAMELFILGHEVGHFFLEEKLSSGSEQRAGPQAEMACDQYGLLVSRTASSGLGNWAAFTGCGAYLFLRAIEMSAMFEDKAGEDSGSHPQVEARAAGVIKYVLDNTAQDQLPAVGAYLSEYKLICDELQAFLVSAVPLFRH